MTSDKLSKDIVFWDDEFNGKASGGYFVRNDLFKFFKKLQKDGLRPVGIRVTDSYNLEVIVEDKGAEKTKEGTIEEDK